MGQSFQFYNLDSPVAVKTSVIGKFMEFFYSASRYDASLLEALWNPGEGEKRVEVLLVQEIKGIILREPAEENTSKGLMCRISTELVAKIMVDVEKLPDLLAMMLTCQRLWDIGRPMLAELVEDVFLISCAGDRLIVFGDHAQVRDLPCGMLKPSEIKWIQEWRKENPKHKDDLIRIIRLLQKDNQRRNFGVGSVGKPVPLTRPRGRRFTDDLLTGSGTFKSWWISNLEEYGAQYEDLVEALGSLVTIKVRDAAKDFFEGRAVLRNLKTKEYISWSSVRSSNTQGTRLRVDDLSFEHILYIRLIWTSNPDFGSMDSGDIYQGVWAGHPFEVVRTESVQDANGTPIEGWKDVSAKVVREVASI